MKVLVCGEGPNDLGQPDQWNDRLRVYHDTEGWLQPLIRRVWDGGRPRFKTLRRHELTTLPKEARRFQPWPRGHGQKALLAKRFAVAGAYDAVIYMVDADAVEPRRWREINSEIQDGFDRIDGAVHCIACIPMSTSESWLLADAAAWQAFAQFEGTLPGRPERLWGDRDDPQSDHPHQVFKRVCAEAGIADSSWTRAGLAENIVPGTLGTACPVSFQPFAKKLREIAA